MTNPLSASATRVLLIGLVAVLGLSLAARAVLPLGDWYAVKATACFAIIAAIAIGVVTGHHPFPRFGAANQVTTTRAAIVALVAGLIGEAPRPILAASASLAGLVVTLLDGVDGWLARRARMGSSYGARFDMETDAVLILALAVLVWTFGKAGVWVVVSGLLRYVFLVSSWLCGWMPATLPPSSRRQMICVVQIVGLLLAIVPAITPPLSAWLAGIALLMLCYSFAVDAVWLWRNRQA